jgi:hypothetical protein
MKTLTLFLLTLALGSSLAVAQSAPAPKAPPGRASPHDTTSTFIGGNYMTGSLVMVTYGRPFTKHPQTGAPRKIWGGLVPWGQPWRAGANEASLLLNQHPMVIGGATLQPGAYVIYLVPVETGASKLVFSRATGRWGDPVDTTQDVARVDLARSALATPVDQFTIAIVSGTGNTGTLQFSWETTQFSVPFEVRR